ncbi:MAG: twin-arginine translocation signal domain-containing protein, partial [Anaerolineales bacterium]|nr:twin-arginine translocation signal domain-containing protein [Anaerolineales bacterium]
MPEETVHKQLQGKGVSRRDFLKLSGLLATAMGLTAVPPLEESGLPASMGVRAQASKMVARALETAQRLPVIWLNFQDCT